MFSPQEIEVGDPSIAPPPVNFDENENSEPVFVETEESSLPEQVQE